MIRTTTGLGRRTLRRKLSAACSCPFGCCFLHSSSTSGGMAASTATTNALFRCTLAGQPGHKEIISFSSDRPGTRWWTLMLRFPFLARRTPGTDSRPSSTPLPAGRQSARPGAGACSRSRTCRAPASSPSRTGSAARAERPFLWASSLIPSIRAAVPPGAGSGPCLPAWVAKSTASRLSGQVLQSVSA